jgi:MinD superfamily P-loop ATPase
MRFAIASGKGGSGKTTVAVNLALTIPGEVTLLDCDVEEPNCHIFLHSARRSGRTTIPVMVLTPRVEEEKCTACGACSDLCQYHAIVALKTRPLLFPELCHGCGGCARVCPVEAISEIEHRVGVVEEERIGDIHFFQGRLKVGEVMATPVIRALKRCPGQAGTVILDAPPGTSCPVIETVRESDFTILVAESTPFGLNDLKLAVELVRTIGTPFGVVINRAEAWNTLVLDYCVEEDLPVLLEIPDDRRIAEAYARGIPAVAAFPEKAELFELLYRRITAGMANANALCSDPRGG